MRLQDLSGDVFVHQKTGSAVGVQYPDDTTYDMLVMTAKKTFVDDDYDILPEYLSVPFEIMS